MLYKIKLATLPETVNKFRRKKFKNNFARKKCMKLIWRKAKGMRCMIGTRVARWFVFKPKIPILVKFRGRWNRK
jgi:hypothetical protein